MALNKVFFIIIGSIFFECANAIVNKDIKKLQQIETKQILSNLRFISKDGKITLYQKSNGELSVSKNYKIKILLKGKKYTDYQIIEGSENFLLITKDEKFFSLISPTKNKEIYLLDLKTLNLKKIANGTDPRLHLSDTWFSYYRAKQKKIYFSKLTMPPKEITLSLNAGLNPYFIPNREVMEDQTILFTDMNERGEIALLKSIKNKTSLLKKHSSLNMAIEICQNQKMVIIGEFNSTHDNPSAKIFFFKDKKLQEDNPLYSSSSNDIGKINCSFNPSKIYFIKSFPTEDLTHSELVELDIKSKKITQLTEEKFIHQFFPMGSRLFATVNGKQLLVLGKKELNDDRLPSDGR